MPDPITTLGLAKKTSEIIKEALEFARETKNTDLAEKLIDLYRDFVTISETNQDLRNEVNGLKAELRTKAAMSFKAPVYFRDGDSTPYCPRCFEKDNEAIHLVCWDGGKGVHWYCQECQKSFFTTSSVR